MNGKVLKEAFRISLPVLFGYIACGIPYGLLVVSKGYPWYLAPVSSLLMFAGAGQFIAVGLFSAGASLSTVLVTELCVNIRHIVYGLSLIEPFKKCRKWKPYLIFALTDETYALLTSAKVPDEAEPEKFYAAVALLDQFYWVAGSLIGAVSGHLIPSEYLTGVDFSLTALFIVLLIEQIKASKDLVPPAAGIFSCIATILLAKFNIIHSQNILITAIAFGMACIFIFKRKSFNEDLRKSKS